MKKSCLIFLIIIFLLPSIVFALDEDGRTTQSPLTRPWMLMGRGVVNIVGLPMEIPLTLAREGDKHSWLWPVSFPPRLVTNIITRSASAVNDFFFFPWVASFTDDLSPWTEPMGLPEYPWQFE
ncbi:MAG: hypothetical protein HYZ85_01200 [Candidatus Omnitrophica bacterium]|nr:hypothetical protein [Candidatus Omnitrophota bacterium]